MEGPKNDLTNTQFWDKVNPPLVNDQLTCKGIIVVLNTAIKSTSWALSLGILSYDQMPPILCNLNNEA